MIRTLLLSLSSTTNLSRLRSMKLRPQPPLLQMRTLPQEAQRLGYTRRHDTRVQCPSLQGPKSSYVECSRHLYRSPIVPHVLQRHKPRCGDLPCMWCANRHSDPSLRPDTMMLTIAPCRPCVSLHCHRSRPRYAL